jgi:hypothetical protein
VGAEESADDGRKPSRLNQAGRWLGSPLLVTVVAAVLGGLVLPYVVQGWQNHQKSLEIKTGLVTQMSESSSGTVATSRFLAAKLTPRKADPQPIWNKAYRDWTTASSSIGAKLQAYVSLETGNRWRSFGYSVTDFLSLSVAPKSSSSREAQIDEIHALLPESLRFSQQEHAALAQPRSTPAFQQAYADVSLRLASWRDELVREVLNAHMAGF